MPDVHSGGPQGSVSCPQVFITCTKGEATENTLTFQMKLIFCSLFFLVCVNMYPDHEQRSMLTISICCQKSNMISRVKTKSMIGGRLRSLMPVHDMLFLDGLALHGDDDPWCNFLFKIDIEMSHSLIIICRSVA